MRVARLLLAARQGAAARAPHADLHGLKVSPVIDDLNQPLFPRLDSFIRYSSYILSGGMAFYLVLFHDFGEQEHCFSPVCPNLRGYYIRHLALF